MCGGHTYWYFGVTTLRTMIQYIAFSVFCDSALDVLP